MRRKLRILLTAGAVILSGCAGAPLIPGVGDTAAIPEFQTYREAVRAQHAAGTRVLDRLAVAERHLLDLSGAPMGTGFDPNAATAVLGIGDPPRTATLRRGLETLRAYNESLATVGSGATGQQAAATVGAVRAGLGVVGLMTGGAALTAGSRFNRLATAARVVLPYLGTGADKRRLHANLVAAAPAIRELLLALRAATPEIWQILREAEVVPGNLADPDGIPPAGRQRLEARRQMLAGWVVLIDQTAVTVETAVAVARSGGRGDVPALISATYRLRALADAIAAVRPNNGATR